MNNEEQHIEIREKLRKLPRVKAREGFENELLRRINLLDAETVKTVTSKSSFWESLFGKRSLAWTIPATSLVVIAIVFVGLYFAFYNSKDMQKTLDNKSSANQQSSVESLKTFTSTPENKSTEIPGKDIANDLEISRSPKTETKSLEKGYIETYIDESPKPVEPLKTNVIDSKKESTTYEKADDVGKTGKTIKQTDEKEIGNMNNGVLKEEKKKEESFRSKDTDKKISAPLIKDVDKVKSETSDGKAKEKVESKNSEDVKIKSDAKIKEEAKKKEELKKKEEARKKEEAKKKEELEKLKEKIKDN